MKRTESRTTRAGFTLLEVIVVLGIIVLLMGIMVPLMRGTRDSSLTAQCKNNMRNLALGVIAYAQSMDDGHFPAAGFYRSVSHSASGKKIQYYPQRSWISNKGDVATLNRATTSVFIGDVAHFTDTDDDIRTAVTNGAIWHAAGESFEVYRCPIHERACEKANGRLPGWSYVMNQEFGFNRDQQGRISFFGAAFGRDITVATDTAGLRKKSASRIPRNVLLFAEVQGADVTDSKHGISLKALVSGGGNETDAVLEYTKEEIGFTHPMGKGRYGGNVAFADGHVDTIIMPTEMSRQDLTRYLCQGFDVPHDGRSYSPNSNDE